MEFIMTGNSQFHLIRNLCTIQTFLLLLPTAETATEPQWTSQPGDILVLEGTKLVMNWTHPIQPPLDITWDYKGTDRQPVLDLIMDYTTGAGTYIPIQEQWYERVGYDQSVNGSAIMTLDNVTSADEKYYEVNVKNLDDQRYSLMGQTSVSVVSRADINTTVTINKKSFELSLLGNGTQVILPDYDESTSSIQVMVHVNGTAPKPRNISIQIRERTLLLTEHSCHSSYRCERYIYIQNITFLTQEVDPSISVSVSFNVQNLPPFVVTQVIRTNRFSAPEWVTQPGDVQVLQGTTLVLNWTHPIQPPLDITWDYKGTDSRRVLDLIMSYTTGAGVYIPKQDKWSGRVGYDQSINGSAIMTLDNVTSADEEYYEVKVRNWEDQRYTLWGRSSIYVVSDEDINTNVTIANKTFKLSLLNNGTNVSLPGEAMIIPLHMRVAVHVRSEAPKPRNIVIENIVDGKVYNKHSCESNYGCEGYIQFSVSPTHAELVININFNVQNLPPVLISQMYQPNGPSSTPVMGVIISLTTAFVVLIGICAGYLLIRWHSKRIEETRMQDRYSRL